ncbi:MAG: hypothetical protein KIH09_15805 [Candidatus Freyarchaeota archaeon]|nr:hypothetical protein [Candidatus Jordarchaeia archaeon]
MSYYYTYFHDYRSKIHRPKIYKCRRRGGLKIFRIRGCGQKVKDCGKLSSKACLSSLCVFVRCFGADFILYGPMRMAGVVFPACAMADAILTYSAVTQGYEPKDKNIPFYKIF